MELYKEMLLDMCYRALAQIKSILLEDRLTQEQRLREIEAVMVWFKDMGTGSACRWDRS